MLLAGELSPHRHHMVVGGRQVCLGCLSELIDFQSQLDQMERTRPLIQNPLRI